MLLKRLLLLVSVTTVYAQSLLEALGTTNSTSALLALLGTVNQTSPALLSALSSASNITILAPSNDAIGKLLNDSAAVAAIAADPGLLVAVLQYHVLEGTYYASQITNTSQFIPTLLTNSTYANVTGGQRVEAVLSNGNATFLSGLKLNSTVEQANLNFTGGTIHVINKILTVPLNDTQTAIDANLTAVAGAVRAAGLEGTVNGLKDVTIFVPTNNAFSAISSIASNLSADALSSVLKYHVVPSVLYSTKLGNVSVATADNVNLTITVFPNGQVFVNNAKVITPDVLVANGVVHVIDNVLNPANATAATGTASSGSPAFGGASSAGSGVPFTSGIPGPTSTVPAGGPATTSSSTGAAAVPLRTGAVAAAALFGGAAVWANL